MKTRPLFGNYLSAFIASVTICVLVENYKVSADGVFEIRIDQFVNQAGRAKYGQCCEGSVVEGLGICNKTCQTSFNVCLSHFQSNISPDMECTFGSGRTQVLGSNMVGPMKHEEFGKNVVELKFVFRWLGTFVLVIEATHEQSDGNLPDTLIARMEKKGNVAPNTDWKTETQTQQEKILTYSYRVRCDKHYYGDGCSKYCKPRDDSFGHWVCNEDGEKVCLPGWKYGKDKYCVEPICLPGCDKTHGTCKRPNECECTGFWTGELCDKCQPYPGCLHGTCEKNFECNCDPGWGGMLCTLDLNICTTRKPCKNGARCTNSDHGSFKCECPPGLTGRVCDEKVECEPNPCKNGAKCTAKEFGGYTCECPANYFGQNCDGAHVSCATEPCKNGGECVGDSTHYTCKCKHGFRGDNCEIEDVDCSSTTCLNGGTCRDSKQGYFCSCRAGYFGRRCQRNANVCTEDTCVNGGKCVGISGGFRCQCMDGYTGPRCEKLMTCQDYPCKNGGQCTDVPVGYECKCKNEFTGRNCDESSPCSVNPCENNGRCVSHGKTSFRCMCGPNHRGQRCEKAVVSGLSSSSMHHSQYDENKDTRIILVTKNEKNGLNTTQWIAVCFGAAFLLLIFVGVAIGIAYHRHGRFLYTGGRSVKSQSGSTESSNQEAETLSDRSSAVLYPAVTPSKTGLIAGDLSQDLDGFSSEIMVVPTNTLSPTRKSHHGSKSTEFLSISTENHYRERREKRSSLNLSNTTHGHKYPKHAHSHYDIEYIKRHDTPSIRSSSCSSGSAAYPLNQVSSSRGRHDSTRLPTYQEACREDRV